MPFMDQRPHAATLTLTDFLLARIAEDEAVARSHDAELEREFGTPARTLLASDLALIGTGYMDYPAVSIDSTRVLAECEAKRTIVKECRALIDSFGDWDAEVGARALWTDVNRRERSQAHGRLHTLAAVYADHPDYRDEWRP